MSSANGTTPTYGKAHADPGGPGDARPTATQILQDEGLLTLPNRLTDKTVLITGGTSGLGLEIARALHATGAKVVVSGRCDAVKGDEIAASIGRGATAGKGLHPVRFVHIDLADLDSVKHGATTFLQQSGDNLHLLICNAGIMSPKARQTTAQDHEMQFGVNYLAHFLMVQVLRPALLASSAAEFSSRVVVVSSCAHRNGGLLPNRDYDCRETKYDPGATYGQSKTADIYLANSIERKFGARGLHAVSVHPGVIMETGITRHMTDDSKELEAQIAKSAPDFTRWGKNAEQGAGCILWAAVAAKLDGVGGVFLEDCDVAQPVKDGADWFHPGRAVWCYNEAAEDSLWADSEKLVERWT